MERWHGKKLAKLETDDAFMQAYRDWEKQMIRAIRAGLLDHPHVRAFVESRRSRSHKPNNGNTVRMAARNTIVSMGKPPKRGFGPFYPLLC